MSQNVEIPVKLETEGQLRLVFVGTGSAFSKKYYQTNLLIVKGTDHLLIDVGSRASEALAKLGLSVTKIRNYLITHSHADHIGGLEEVALINRYAAHQKTTMIITDEYRDALWHMSLEGGCSFNEEHGGKNLSYDDFFIQASPLPVKGFEDIDLRQINLGSIDIKIFRTRHIPDSAPTWRESFFSYGIILDNRVLFTADTRFDPEVIIRFGVQCKKQVELR
jgi:ribonuclease BN (tRNA processing enzyme)